MDNNTVKKNKWYMNDNLISDKNLCPIPFYEISSTKDITWVAMVGAGDLKEDGEARANAELIVKSVNNYPQLMDIAKRCAFIFGNEANYPEGTIGYRLAKDAKEALKNAE